MQTFPVFSLNIKNLTGRPGGLINAKALSSSPYITIDTALHSPPESRRAVSQEPEDI